MRTTGRLFWNALAAFLILPGMVGFALPWLFRPRSAAFDVTGLPLLAVGVALLLWCVRDFFVVGRGTLAPWAPPEHLVVVGLYRFTRNPMYVAVLVILCGWALSYRSATLWQYAAVVAVGFHLRVVFGEEPWLGRTHGRQWSAYAAAVPRWLFPTSLTHHRPTGGA